MPRPKMKVAIFLLLALSSSDLLAESAIGLNWGTISSHRLNPSTVVDLLKQNKFQKVKLFEADAYVLRGLAGSGIEVMVGIPNEMLSALSSSPSASDLWVRQNISSFIGKGGVDFRYAGFYSTPPCCFPFQSSW